MSSARTLANPTTLLQRVLRLADFSIWRRQILLAADENALLQLVNASFPESQLTVERHARKPTDHWQHLKKESKKAKC